MNTPRLMDQVVAAIRSRHYSIRTERAYCGWIRRFIRFHGLRHPRELGKLEVEHFLSDLAVTRRVSASTQNQALAALLFLYGTVLDIKLPWLDDVVRARKPVRLPVVLNTSEVRSLLANLDGVHRLMVELLYGSELRQMELLRLRVKDVDFEMRTLTVRAGKGDKDRVVPLPSSCTHSLRQQLQYVRVLFEADRAMQVAGVDMPDALARKYPAADKTMGWQWVFPMAALSHDPRTGVRRRHHYYPQTLTRAIRVAARRANIIKPVRCHTFRHSFATHLLQAGTDIRSIQAMLGHAHVETTMIYTHVAQLGAGAVSPLDRL